MAWIIKHIVTICIFLGYYQTMRIDGETIRAQPHYKVVNVSSLESKPYCQRSISGPKIGSQKLDIVSRFGPCSPKANRTKTPSANELVNWDQARVRSINKRVNGHVYSSSLSENGVDSTTEFGGVYNVKIGLGTPKQYYNLMMDTGSEPTWVRCQSCTEGCLSEDPLYDYSKSSTYTNNSNLCKGTSDPFSVHYGDKSHTDGTWGCDTLTIEGIGAIKNFRFGCGLENVDETGNNFDDVAGILGLGKGDLSLPSQSASSMQMFSYYFPPTNSHVGNLLFGNEAMKKSQACSNQFTPMVKGSDPIYYYLNLVGISVAGNKLNVASTTFTNEGTVIDSGTVISRLPQVVYSALRAAFRQSMSS